MSDTVTQTLAELWAVDAAYKREGSVKVLQRLYSSLELSAQLCSVRGAGTAAASLMREADIIADAIAQIRAHKGET